MEVLGFRVLLMMWHIAVSNACICPMAGLGVATKE